MSWHWPERICVRCGVTYIPKWRGQKFHNRKCFGISMTVRQRGRDMEAMQRRRSEVMRARFRARIEAEFGQLSDRELTLIKKAMQLGYQKCYRSLGRREAA